MKTIKFILSTLFAVLSLHCMAQLVVTENVHLLENDVRAKQYNNSNPVIQDGEQELFALLIVRTTAGELIFEHGGRNIFRQESKEGENGVFLNEYWVCLRKGTKNFIIRSKNATAVDVKFDAVEPLETYMMTISDQRETGTLFLTSNVDAEAFIDNVKICDLTKDEEFKYVGAAGEHKLKLTAEGYATQELDITIKQQRTVVKDVTMFSKEGSVSLDGVSYGTVNVSNNGAAITFTMGLEGGSYYETPTHQVTLRPFNIGSTFVTVDLWKSVMGEAEERIKGPKGEVVNVTYGEILDFIGELNRKTKKNYRLPTEAEWEYCAAKDRHIELGIKDFKSKMEWCSDWFGKYPLNAADNPQGPETGILRVVRGGSEYQAFDPAYARPTYRWRKDPYKASEKISFRLAMDE